METWAGWVLQPLLQVSLEDASTDARSNALVITVSLGRTVSLKFRVALLPRARADGRRCCCRAS